MRMSRKLGLSAIAVAISALILFTTMPTIRADNVISPSGDYYVTDIEVLYNPIYE